MSDDEHSRRFALGLAYVHRHLAPLIPEYFRLAEQCFDDFEWAVPLVDAAEAELIDPAGTTPPMFYGLPIVADPNVGRPCVRVAALR